MTGPEEPRRARGHASGASSRRRARFIVGLVVGVAIVTGVALTPARPAALVVAVIGGVVLTQMAAGLGRRRTLVAVWHDARHVGGVERRLLAIATTPESAGRLSREASTLPGFCDSTSGISLQPEAIGVLETAEAWRLLRRRRWSRLDNRIGPTVWFLTDAEAPTLLLPGDSALGFATTLESAERVADARRHESLGHPASVRAVELPVGQVLWPRGVTAALIAARPLDHRDALLQAAPPGTSGA